MLIKSLVKKGKNVLITFDDDSELKISEEVVLKNGLRKNDVLSGTEIDSLKDENNKYLIKSKAFDLLSRRLHSKGELKRKLLKKNFPPELIAPVLNELEAKNYLNDFEYAKLLSEEKIIRKKKGISLVRKELIGKNIGREIIDEVLSLYSDELLYENALDIAGKKLKYLQNSGVDKFKIIGKLKSFLVSRGNDFETINKVIHTLFPDKTK